jgi:hypothetical protein
MSYVKNAQYDTDTTATTACADNSNVFSAAPPVCTCRFAAEATAHTWPGVQKAWGPIVSPEQSKKIYVAKQQYCLDTNLAISSGVAGRSLAVFATSRASEAHASSFLA